MASQLFGEPFVQAQIKENIKVPCHWPLWGESTCGKGIPPYKGPVMQIFYPFDDIIMCWWWMAQLTINVLTSSTKITFTGLGQFSNQMCICELQSTIHTAWNKFNCLEEEEFKAIQWPEQSREGSECHRGYLGPKGCLSQWFSSENPLLQAWGI